MSKCSECGALFSCAMTSPDEDAACWCTALPSLPAAEIALLAARSGGRCLCRQCLQAAIAQTDGTTNPSRERPA